jgi:hypothetical protein
LRPPLFDSLLHHDHHDLVLLLLHSMDTGVLRIDG